MVVPRPFRLIMTAPTDRPIEVIYGKPESVTLARWDEHLQVWIRVDDPARRALHRVIGWRPVAREHNG